MKVWINGVKVGGDVSQNPAKAPQSIVEGYEAPAEYAGGIDWTKPIVDVGPYLADGENTIVIEYSSNLINAVLNEGILQESKNYNGWWNSYVRYLSYGPSQAVLVPYAEAGL